VKKAVIIFFFLGSIGVVYAGGSHKEDHHQKAANAHWQAPQEALNQVNPVPADSNSIESGKNLYVVAVCQVSWGECARRWARHFFSVN
jgi:hypothetical protein